MLVIKLAVPIRQLIVTGHSSQLVTLCNACAMAVIETSAATSITVSKTFTRQMHSGDTPVNL